jgi:hypothetical protein
VLSEYVIDLADSCGELTPTDTGPCAVPTE